MERLLLNPCVGKLQPHMPHAEMPASAPLTPLPPSGGSSEAAASIRAIFVPRFPELAAAFENMVQEAHRFEAVADRLARSATPHQVMHLSVGQAAIRGGGQPLMPRLSHFDLGLGLARTQSAQAAGAASRPVHGFPAYPAPPAAAAQGPARGARAGAGLQQAKANSQQRPSRGPEEEEEEEDEADDFVVVEDSDDASAAPQAADPAPRRGQPQQAAALSSAETVDVSSSPPVIEVDEDSGTPRQVVGSTQQETSRRVPSVAPAPTPAAAAASAEAAQAEPPLPQHQKVPDEAERWAAAVSDASPSLPLKQRTANRVRRHVEQERATHQRETAEFWEANWLRAEALVERAQRARKQASARLDAAFPPGDAAFPRRDAAPGGEWSASAGPLYPVSALHGEEERAMVGTPPPGVASSWRPPTRCAFASAHLSEARLPKVLQTGRAEDRRAGLAGRVLAPNTQTCAEVRITGAKQLHVRMRAACIPVGPRLPRAATWVHLLSNFRAEDDTVLRYVPYFGDDDTTGVDVSFFEVVPGEQQQEVNDPVHVRAMQVSGHTPARPLLRRGCILTPLCAPVPL